MEIHLALSRPIGEVGEFRSTAGQPCGLVQINTGIPDNGYAGTPPIRASFNVRNLNYGDRSAPATIRSPVAVFPFGVPGMWGYRPLSGVGILDGGRRPYEVFGQPCEPVGRNDIRH